MAALFTGASFADRVWRMSKLEPIVEELKTLPDAKLAEAASFIHRLKESSTIERRAALNNTAGALTVAEADELSRIIEDGCEQVDAHEW
jgi:3-phosphoglycerate kinase